MRLAGHPFNFSPLREGVLDLAAVRTLRVERHRTTLLTSPSTCFVIGNRGAQVTGAEQRAKLQRPLTVGLLAVITSLAMVLKVRVRDVWVCVHTTGALLPCLTP